jgi:hypothetical protein
MCGSFRIFPVFFLYLFDRLLIAGPVGAGRKARSKQMTEDQIERRIERVMDALDARLMDGRLSQADYDWEVKNLETWASQQYRASGYEPDARGYEGSNDMSFDYP